MPAWWLTFKPLRPDTPRGWPVERLNELLQRFHDNPSDTTQWWRIAAHRSANIGDRIYLFKQGEDPRGIFGVGKIIGGPELKSAGSAQDTEAYQALIQFESLVNPFDGFLLDMAELSDIVPEQLINAQASGQRVNDDVAVEIEKRLLSKQNIPLAPTESDDVSFDPESVEDDGERALRAIRIRRGQAAFRGALIRAYAERCAITGCSVPDVLEAAHIMPYRGNHTNHTSNGLLLRSDIHTLFDCGLIAIHPETREVVIATALEKSVYAKISGRVLRPPESPELGPSKMNLQRRFEMFRSIHKNTR